LKGKSMNIRRAITFVLGLIGLAVVAAASAATPQWAWSAGQINTNGSITIQSLKGGGTTYSGTQNPTGAVAKVNQNAVTQPPTVILQSTAGLPVKTVGSPCNSSTDTAAVTSDRSTLLLCQSGRWGAQPKSFGNLASYTFVGNGVSAGANTGYHDLCAMSGLYQNGNNGWVYMTPGPTNSAGKRYYTVTSTCAAQGCGSGSMSITVNCWDLI
jgi:hypothetical protein